MGQRKGKLRRVVEVPRSQTSETPPPFACGSLRFPFGLRSGRLLRVWSGLFRDRMLRGDVFETWVEKGEKAGRVERKLRTFSSWEREVLVFVVVFFWGVRLVWGNGMTEGKYLSVLSSGLLFRPV